MAKTTNIVTLNDKAVDELTLGKLKEYAKNYFLKNIDGKRIVNKDKGITVIINKNSLRHIIHARNAGYIKYKAILIVDKMMENATFCNFKNPDADDDPINIIGYLNFKAAVNIEKKIHYFRIAVRITNAGKFYYDHSVVVKK